MTAASWKAYCAFRRYIVDNQAALLDILAKWDDGDGCTTSKEFRQGWGVLALDAGLDVSRALLDELYEEMDVEQTGNIPHEDIALALKHMPLPDPQEIVDDDEDAVPPSPSSVQSPDAKRSKALPQVSPRATPRGEGSGGDFQPPRRENLPRLSKGHSGGGAGAGGSFSPRRSMRESGAMSTAGSVAPTTMTAMTSATGCTSSTHAGLSPAERHRQRARREHELTTQFKRYNLPGFNVPEGGKYQPRDSLTTFAVLKAPRKKTGGVRPSPWGVDSMTQHETLDSKWQPIVDGRKKTHTGDPGWYFSKNHEMYQPTGTNPAGVMFQSPIPQRPIAVNRGQGEPAVLPWQMWKGFE